MRRSLSASLGLVVLIAGCGPDGAGDDTDTDAASSTGSTTVAEPGSSSGIATTSSGSTGAADEDSSSSEGSSSGSESSGAATVCGDGVVDEGEACDDGEATERCDAACGWVPGGLRWTAPIPNLYARACIVTDTALLVGGSYEADTLDAMIVEFGLDGPSFELRPVDEEADDAELTALAVGDDGRVYAAGERGSLQPFSIAGHAWAVDSSFGPLWNVAIEDEGQPAAVTTRVAVSGDGVVFGSSEAGFVNGLVTGLTPGGEVQWSTAIGGTLRDLTLLDDGSIVVVGSGGVSRVSPDGASVSSLSAIGALAVARSEAGLVLAQEAGGVVGLSLAGAELWSESLEQGDITAMALDDAGNVDLLRATDAGFVLFELDGQELADPDVEATQRWSVEFESTGSNPITGGIAIGPDGVVFLCGTTGGQPESVVWAVSG